MTPWAVRECRHATLATTTDQWVSQVSVDRRAFPEALRLIDPACASMVAALAGDPFYRCISSEFGTDDARRRAALTQYFNYSIRQGARIGRVVHLDEAEIGVAVWVLPQSGEVQEREKSRKARFLRKALGGHGYLSYEQIVGYMSARAGTVLGSDAWYLSIVAVAPRAQGQGLGARLLAPTLAEAAAARAVCYLETFNPRSLRFYERLGFATQAEFDEPRTRARYAIMTRVPVLGTHLRQYGQPG
jgi:ribosomal protein S18 acetylase RimI-like enzyme